MRSTPGLSGQLLAVPGDGDWPGCLAQSPAFRDPHTPVSTEIVLFLRDRPGSGTGQAHLFHKLLVPPVQGLLLSNPLHVLENERDAGG